MRSMPESIVGKALTVGLTGVVGMAALSACRLSDGDAANRSCKIAIAPAGDGYDITARYSGTFPDGTVFTGHVNYRSGAGDGWDQWTPEDFTVPIGGSAHYAKTITHNGEEMSLESAQGTLDPTPDGHAVRTGCGSATVEA